MDKKRTKASYVVLLILVLLATALLGIMYCRKNLDYFFFDFEGQWKILAYFLRGYNPYQLTSGQVAAVGSLGVIPAGWGTAPWGFILGNAIYFGFLPYDTAKACFLILNAAVHICFSIGVYKHMKQKYRPLAIYAFIICLTMFNFHIAVFKGNAGGMMCELAITGYFLAGKKPWLSGLVLTFAMIKPQVTCLILLTLILEKKLREVAVTVIVTGISTAAVLLTLHRNLPEIISDFMGVNVGNSLNYTGICAVLEGRLGHMGATAASMAVGIAAMIIMVLIMKKKGIKDRVFLAVPACIMTTFWCYSWDNDLAILTIPVMVSLEVFAQHKKTACRMLSGLMVMLFITCPYIRQLMITGIGNANLSNTLFSLLLLAAGMILTAMLCRTGQLAERQVMPRTESQAQASGTRDAVNATRQ